MMSWFWKTKRPLSAAEAFAAKKSEEGDYGICPAPTKAQEALNALMEHFLGEDWYVTLPLSQEQANTEIVYAILLEHPKKRRK